MQQNDIKHILQGLLKASFFQVRVSISSLFQDLHHDQFILHLKSSQFYTQHRQRRKLT